MEDQNNLGLVNLENSEFLFVQANSLIEARNKTTLTFLERMLFSKMCTMIDPNDTDFIEYTIYIKDIIDLLGNVDSGRTYQNVIAAARKLNSSAVTIHLKDKETGKEEILETNLVIGMKRAKTTDSARDTYIKLAFHPDLKPYLLRLKSNFTKLDIRNLPQLHSGSTVHLYQLLKQYENAHSKYREISLVDLKMMLGISNKYPLYGSFKQRILDEAQLRINQYTDISFDYLEIKTGKKVTAIRFFIHKKAKIKKLPVGELQVLQEPVVVTEAVQNQLFDEIYPTVQPWGITASTLIRLTQEYTPDLIRTAARLTLKNQRAGKIKENVAGFFVKALKEGYVDTAEKSVLEREKRREIAIVKQQTQVSREAESVRLKNELVRKQTSMALSLIETNPQLIEKALEKILLSLVGRSIYNANISIDENLKSPIFLSSFVSAIMKICPDDFIFDTLA
jgi:plasmid replication initiation protein